LAGAIEALFGANAISGGSSKTCRAFAIATASSELALANEGELHLHQDNAIVLLCSGEGQKG
jgi:hypothetical protein